MVVNDGIFTDQTLVEVSIIDVNDNPPVFHPSSYQITNVTEEVQYSTSNPLKLLTVRYQYNWYEIGVTYIYVMGIY